MPFKIHVPARPGVLGGTIMPGSAIVSDGTVRDGRVLVHFEGNAHGASNLLEFHERMVSAAGRLARSYPTTATGLLRADDLHDVALVDPDRLVVTDVLEPEILEAWSGEKVAAISGSRMKPGRHVEMADGEFLNQLAHLGHDGEGWLYRSRAGQIVAANGIGGIMVYDHDDQEIVARLRGMLDDDRLAWAVGRPSAPAMTF